MQIPAPGMLRKALLNGALLPQHAYEVSQMRIGNARLAGGRIPQDGSKINTSRQGHAAGKLADPLLIPLLRGGFLGG